jgi:hypothetical protein
MITRMYGNDMLQNVAEFLSHHSLEGLDDASLEQWKLSCYASWKLLAKDFLTKSDATRGERMLHTILEAYADLARLVATKQYKSASGWTEAERRRSMEALLSRPQIEQRTEAWYLDAAGLLSASQFSVILKSGRTRALVVVQKAVAEPPDVGNRRTVVSTANLNPFTWGIRFEPIVKQIYEHLTSTTLTELGRLKHSVDPRLAASPDGLVVEGPIERLGRFVEFKAPVTRTILDKVPEEYMAQMQIQMEVGNVEECDYLEVKFHSQYGKNDGLKMPEPVPPYYGVIHVITNKETGEPIRYDYSALNTHTHESILEDHEELSERIPWWCNQWFIKTIGRSRAWFTSVQPDIQLFWEDVVKARQGTFVVPPSSRKKKEDVCLIHEEPSPPTPPMFVEDD